MQTNIPDKSTGSYTNLETPTKAQQALLNKYDVRRLPRQQRRDPVRRLRQQVPDRRGQLQPAGALRAQLGQIASDLKNPDSAVAKAIDGTANYITAAICKMTGNQPASACTSTVQSLESQICKS